MSDRAVVALENLRGQGQRITPARRSIVELLASTDDHLGAEEIVRRVSSAAGGAHRATVFRALSTLAELGVLSHTHLAGTGTVYHLTHHPHAHLQCSSCGAVIDVDASVLGPVARRLRDDLGFELAAEHAALLGTCQDCRARLSRPISSAD